MENLESSLKFEIQENNLPPNIILEQIKNQSNYGINNIITKNIRFNKNPINKIDYGKDDMKNLKYIKITKKKINLNYSNNNPINKIGVNNNSRNTVNIYSKKKLSDGLISSSATSGINSLLSNTQKNNILSNIEFIEEYPNNNIENNNINNIYNIKTTNNKSTNILIKNIYSNDDYFNRNINEGMLHLKDFEIYKSNKISQFDMEKQTEKSNENKDIRKSLSQILIKSEQKNNNNNLTNSCDFKNRNINFKTCDKTQENRIMNRQLSERIILRRNHANKNISNLIYYFNKKKKYSDQIITRGSRNEKGGVVDFSTVSPKKYYRNDRYIIKHETKNKTEYKYPKWKIISSAKIIQNWWRIKKIIYFMYINKIKKIQQNFKNHLLKINNKESNSKKKIYPDTNTKLGIIILKKVMEVKLVNLLSLILIKIKNYIDYITKEKIDIIKYSYFIKNIIDYVKNIKKKNIFLFLLKLKDNNHPKEAYLNTINTSSLNIKEKKNVLIHKKKLSKTNFRKFKYYSTNTNNINIKIIYNQKNTMKFYNLIYRILLISIIDKIKKEANRRTLIKAFRDINKMKYPILYYSLLKLQKYCIIKYNIMNAYAELIQRNYREYVYKKLKKSQFYH